MVSPYLTRPCRSEAEARADQQTQILHCWEDGPRAGIWPRDSSTTCMLKDGHEGAHEWTRDDQILVRFLP